MNVGTNINVSQLLNAPVRRCLGVPLKKGTQKKGQMEMEALRDAAKTGLSSLK